MKKLFSKIKCLYDIIKEKFETHLLTIFLITMIVVLLCTTGTTWLFPSYYNIEVEELVDKQEKLIEEQSRGLTFATNELKLQIAYTERLRLILDLNGIEYKRYSDFLSEDIFKDNELKDENYLYEADLDMEILLIRANIRGNTFYGETNESDTDSGYSVDSNSYTDD